MLIRKKFKRLGVISSTLRVEKIVQLAFIIIEKVRHDRRYRRER